MTFSIRLTHSYFNTPFTYFSNLILSGISICHFDLSAIITVISLITVVVICVQFTDFINVRDANTGQENIQMLLMQ